MVYPLDNWTSQKIGYRHGDTTFYNNFHLGIDVLIPEGTELYAPEDGYLSQHYGAQGGNTLELVGGLTHRFMHLSKVLRGGQVKAGDLIAYTGNTGLSTDPHLHWDVRSNGASIGNRSKFRDPLTLPLQQRGTDVSVDELASEYANIFARVHQNLNGKPPVMDSIEREARDAAERRKNGETYAGNSYIDKYFSEAPKSEDAKRVKEKAIQIEELALAKLKEL